MKLHPEELPWATLHTRLTPFEGARPRSDGRSRRRPAAHLTCRIIDPSATLSGATPVSAGFLATEPENSSPRSSLPDAGPVPPSAWGRHPRSGRLHDSASPTRSARVAGDGAGRPKPPLSEPTDGRRTDRDDGVTGGRSRTGQVAATRGPGGGSAAGRARPAAVAPRGARSRPEDPARAPAAVTDQDLE
jgi:hypothetical protein